jgi:hypothetical protein
MGGIRFRTIITNTPRTSGQENYLVAKQFHISIVTEYPVMIYRTTIFFLTIKSNTNVAR